MPPENLPARRGHLEPRDEDTTQVPRGLRAVLLIYKPDGTRAGYDIDSPDISVEAHHDYADGDGAVSVRAADREHAHREAEPKDYGVRVVRYDCHVQ